MSMIGSQLKKKKYKKYQVLYYAISLFVFKLKSQTLPSQDFENSSQSLPYQFGKPVCQTLRNLMDFSYFMNWVVQNTSSVPLFCFMYFHNSKEKWVGKVHVCPQKTLFSIGFETSHF